MRCRAGLLVCLLVAGCAASSRTETMPALPRLVSFSTSDGGIVYADEYGRGDRGLVLAHGGRFTKESWARQAPAFVEAGFCVLAIDFRGRGQSRGRPQPTSADDVHLDVLAAIGYLRENGARTVSVIGASFGGGAAAEAAARAPAGTIERLVLLAHSPIDSPEKINAGRTLVVLAKDDVSGAGCWERCCDSCPRTSAPSRGTPRAASASPARACRRRTACRRPSRRA